LRADVNEQGKTLKVVWKIPRGAGGHPAQLGLRKAVAQHSTVPSMRSLGSDPCPARTPLGGCNTPYTRQFKSIQNAKTA